MSLRNKCISIYNTCKKVGKHALFYILSAGKLINSGAQANYGTVSSINYIEKTHVPSGTSEYNHASSLGIGLSFIALAANLELTTVTRIPSLRKKILGTVAPENSPTHQGLQWRDFSADHPHIYYISRGISYFSGAGSLAFSTINSWLFGKTLVQFLFSLANIQSDDKEWEETILIVGLIISTYQAISSGYSFLTYNVQEKILRNGKKAAIKYINRDWYAPNWDSNTRRIVLKTSIYSLFNLLSISSFSYYSSKKAISHILKDLHIADLNEENDVIKYVAGFSILSTLTTTCLTSIPAVYRWMSRDGNIYNHDLDQTRSFRILRAATFICGLLDTIFTFLGFFRGAASFFRDFPTHFPFYSVGSILAGVTCAMVGAFNNIVFNVYEGFNDYRDLAIARWESSRMLLNAANSETVITIDSFPPPVQIEMQPLEIPYHPLVDDSTASEGQTPPSPSLIPMGPPDKFYTDNNKFAIFRSSLNRGSPVNAIDLLPRTTFSIN